jgi:hypothetical protein
MRRQKWQHTPGGAALIPAFTELAKDDQQGYAPPGFMLVRGAALVGASRL